MSSKQLPDGAYYEVELIPLGDTIDYTGAGEVISQTADETVWHKGQTVWNIWLTLRLEDDSEIHEVMDLDIPVKLQHTARNLFLWLKARVIVANEHRWYLD